MTGLQSLFTIFEQEALKVGLKVNMGKGKTERIVLGDQAGVLCNAAGAFIPVVTNYRYLGTLVFNWDEDFSKRRTLAWGAVTSLAPIWRSNASPDTKRQLFRKVSYGYLTLYLDSSNSKHKEILATR